MNKKQLDEGLKNFEKHGKTSEELNALRSEIFNSLDAGEIQERTKDRLLKDLYMTANLKEIFFIRLMERSTSGLPKTPEEEEKQRKNHQEEEEEQSYEESYEESYEDNYEEDDEEEKKP